MSEDEKAAEDYAKWAEDENIRDGKRCCEHCGNSAMGDVARTATMRWAKRGFLAGIEYERKRNKPQLKPHETVDFGTHKVRTEDL